MLGTLLLGGIIGVIAAIIASLIALKIQQRRLYSTSIQQQGWERAQEARQQQWELQQEKRSITFEKKLSGNVQEIQQEWHVWEQKDARREQELKQQYEALTIRSALKHEVEHVPLLEEASLPIAENQRRRTDVASAIPAQLQGVDLTGHDLSRRYLHGADLRDATLAYANLFMADLSGACLVGADLSGADLAGANLIDADLRDATLNRANVLVADLNNAILLGTKLHKVRNLTAEQIATTVYDDTTQFDDDNEITLPRIPGIPTFVLSSSSTPSPQSVTASYDIVRAQSLDAIPETPLLVEAEHQPPFLTFPDMLPDTPLSVEEEDDITEIGIPAWTPSSNETLRILEELHLPAQERRRTENFGTSASQEKQDGRRQVRAS